MPAEPWLKRRLWPGLAELGMAFAGLAVGWLVIGTVYAGLELGPAILLAGPLMTALGAAFYGFWGPRWAQGADPDEAVPSPPALPVADLPRTLGLVLLGIVIALAGSIALGLLVELLQGQVKEQQTVLEITQAARAEGLTTEAVLLAVSALVMAPIAEEWLFRRSLFLRVRARSGRLIAYCLSAAGFAAIHNNPAGFVVYLWLGLVFAAVLERTGRFWAAVGVHMGNNGYVLAMLFWGGGGGAA